MGCPRRTCGTCNCWAALPPFVKKLRFGLCPRITKTSRTHEGLSQDDLWDPWLLGCTWRTCGTHSGWVAPPLHEEAEIHGSAQKSPGHPGLMRGIPLSIRECCPEQHLSEKVPTSVPSRETVKPRCPSCEASCTRTREACLGTQVPLFVVTTF